MENLQSLINRCKVQCVPVPGIKTPYERLDTWQIDARKFTVTLRYQTRRLTLAFFQGSAHTTPPTTHDVLSCLLADASYAGYTFDEFARELGYDPDSRAAYKTYRAVATQTARLRRFLGDDFDAFMAAECD